MNIVKTIKTQLIYQTIKVLFSLKKSLLSKPDPIQLRNLDRKKKLMFLKNSLNSSSYKTFEYLSNSSIFIDILSKVLAKSLFSYLNIKNKPLTS